MPLSLEHLATIESDAARIRAAFDTDPNARIPWSERWTVRSVARHVAGAHHVVAQVINGRPTADFGLLHSLVEPSKDDPGFSAWCAAGTEALCDAVRSTDLDEPCWTPMPDGRDVRYWLRRMTHETLVHRWDAELGARWDHAPFDVDVAVDGVDEYLMLAVPTLRRERRSAAAPAVHLTCTDADGSWFVQASDDGGGAVSATPVPVSATLRGPASGLLLALYGRLTIVEAGIEVDGDPSVLEHHDGLLPQS